MILQSNITDDQANDRTPVEYKDNYDDQVINVKLPRRDYEIMRQLIKREQTMNNVTNILRSSWVWVVAGGVLTCWLLWDRIKIGLGG